MSCSWARHQSYGTFVPQTVLTSQPLYLQITLQKCITCTFVKRALISNNKNYCCWNFFLLTYLIGLINGNSAEYDAMMLSANDTSSSNNVSLIFKRFNISENSNLFKRGRELNTLAIGKRKNEITCHANRIFMSFLPRNLVDFNSVILKACV